MSVVASAMRASATLFRNAPVLTGRLNDLH